MMGKKNSNIKHNQLLIFNSFIEYISYISNFVPPLKWMYCCSLPAMSALLVIFVLLASFAPPAVFRLHYLSLSQPFCLLVFPASLTILSPRIEKQQRYTCCIFSFAPAMLAILKIIYQGLTFYVQFFFSVMLLKLISPTHSNRFWCVYGFFYSILVEVVVNEA